MCLFTACFPVSPFMFPMLSPRNLDCRCKQSEKRLCRTFAFKQIDKGNFGKLPPHGCSVGWHVPCVPALLTGSMFKAPILARHATQYGAAHCDSSTVGKYSRSRTETPVTVCLCVCICVCVLVPVCEWGCIQLHKQHHGHR